jgi:hypothetical protein
LENLAVEETAGLWKFLTITSTYSSATPKPPASEWIETTSSSKLFLVFLRVAEGQHRIRLEFPVALEDDLVTVFLSIIRPCENQRLVGKRIDPTTDVNRAIVDDRITLPDM